MSETGCVRRTAIERAQEAADLAKAADDLAKRSPTLSHLSRQQYRNILLVLALSATLSLSVLADKAARE